MESFFLYIERRDDDEDIEKEDSLDRIDEGWESGFFDEQEIYNDNEILLL